MDRNGHFGSACRALDAHGGVAHARNSTSYCCASRLALHAGRDFRIICDIQDTALRILVIEVGNRREIYR